MYDELIGNLRAKATHFHFNDETSLLLCKAADAIEELQKQRKTGKWIHRKVKSQSPYQPYVPSIELFCSECNNHSAWDSPFCSNCGARMANYSESIAKSKQQWIPVTERLPEGGDESGQYGR